MNWYDYAENVFISLFSAFIFWLLTFKYSFANVTFSSKLEKSKSALGFPFHRYRIRIANIGFRDLIEVSVVARLSIKQRGYTCVTQLAIGNQGFIPIIRHYPVLSHKVQNCIHTLTISPTESTKRELSKRFYSKRMQKLAKKRKISLDDIFDEYGNEASIQVYLYGNDRTTGARQLFISPVYTKEDICEGSFNKARDIKFYFFNSQKEKLKKLSQIEPVDT